MIPFARSLAGAAVGAAAMYWLDPRAGRRRRALLRDRVGSATADINDAVGVASRDVRYRARGLGARLRSLFRRDEVPDEVLVERVRAALGRAVSHPGAIDVVASQGRVTLTGSVLAAEYEDLVDAVCSVRGVEDVLDELAVHEFSEGVPELQGGRPRMRSRFALLRENWPPAVRVAMGGTGGALAALGARELFKQRGYGVLGGFAFATGAVLVLRSATNTPVRRLVGGGGRRAIDIRKTLQVNAPIERVFETLADIESFPSFMRNVRSVQRHPDGRSHWVVTGPAGTTVEWDSEITACRPNEVLAWRTVANAPVAHAGIIRFERAGNGTRLDVQMTYNPPGGVFGHGVAKVLGRDPKRELDEDLMRMKTFLETSVTPHDAARRRAQSTSSTGAGPRPI